MTTSESFRDDLNLAARRNERLIAKEKFSLESVEKGSWSSIIDELFEFHNPGEQLADYQVLSGDLDGIVFDSPTIGHAINETTIKLADSVDPLHDLSQYCVFMLWPVSDGVRLQRIQQFTEPRQGYTLNWNAWYRQMAGVLRNSPLQELNKARLYFDLRIVPIQVADLHMLCKDLDSEPHKLGSSYLEQFKKTHLYSIMSGNWDPVSYTPMRERLDSKRAADARDWYASVTNNPTGLGRRLARILRECQFSAEHERDIESPSSKVRADVLVRDRDSTPKNVIIELKAFSSDNTMPSTICEQVRITMRRHAELLGFLKK